MATQVWDTSGNTMSKPTSLLFDPFLYTDEADLRPILYAGSLYSRSLSLSLSLYIYVYLDKPDLDFGVQ